MADGLNRTVHSRVAKTSDIEIHVSTLVTDNGTFTEIREYVQSLEKYGRGITFPATKDIFASVITGVSDAEEALLESTS